MCMWAFFHSQPQDVLSQSQCSGLFSAHDALYITEEFKSHAVCEQWTVTFLPAVHREGVSRLLGSNSAGLAPIAPLSAHWLCHSSCDSVWTESIIHVLRRGQVLIEIPVFPLEWRKPADTHCIMLALSPWKAHLEAVTFLGSSNGPLGKNIVKYKKKGWMKQDKRFWLCENSSITVLVTILWWCEAIFYTEVTEGLDCLWLLAASVVCMLMVGCMNQCHSDRGELSTRNLFLVGSLSQQPTVLVCLLPLNNNCMCWLIAFI